MTISCFALDAVSGSPNYTAQQVRQALGFLTTASVSTRPLGAFSGVHPITPTTTLTISGTTWTCKPHCGVVDAEASAGAAGYFYASDTNVTGSVTAADPTNPRVDLVYVQISDPAQSDGTSVPQAQILYLAGTAASSPVAPATPARSMALGTILVQHSGGSASTTSWVAQYSVASGGVLPCSSSATYPATPYEGMAIYDQALNTELTYNGSSWDKVLTGDTGWVNLSGLGGSYTTPSTVATGKAQYRIKGGIILMQGQISLAAGGNFATSTSIVLIAAGNLPAPITPTLAGVHRTLASATPQEVCKGILGTDGSLTIVTNSTGAPYVNIGGFSGYTID